MSWIWKANAFRAYCKKNFEIYLTKREAWQCAAFPFSLEQNRQIYAGKEKAMNIRKPVDYSALYADLDKLMAAGLSQMERYREIGRLVSARNEKGAAVAASEYLQAAYPTATDFSPRNLRRMREFCRTI